MAGTMDFELLIDKSVSLEHEPGTGHNRWHPGMEPLASVKPGAICRLGTRDGGDCFITRDSHHEDLLRWNLGTAHPLTGPIFVEGAEPGDLLEVEIVEIEPDDFGWTGLIPGFGFLADMFPDPYLVKWEIDGAHARSSELPGVAIPRDPFPGNIGVAPSHEEMARYHARERELRDRGGLVVDDAPDVAFPPTVHDGMRTVPPRETGGNMDNKGVCVGSRLVLPVQVPGALFSVGDLHFAQGDGETCGTGIEMKGTITVRLNLNTDPSWRPRYPAFYSPERTDRSAFATTGIAVTEQGRNEDMDLNLTTRMALLDMIDYLKTTRGFSAEQACALISVAVDLRLSEIVDVPNPVVSALLPLDVFEE